MPASNLLFKPLSYYVCFSSYTDIFGLPALQLQDYVFSVTREFLIAGK